MLLYSTWERVTERAPAPSHQAVWYLGMFKHTLESTKCLPFPQNSLRLGSGEDGHRCPQEQVCSGEQKGSPAPHTGEHGMAAQFSALPLGRPPGLVPTPKPDHREGHLRHELISMLLPIEWKGSRGDDHKRNYIGSRQN